MKVKKLKVINAEGVAPIYDFNGVDASVLFERRVHAAANHFEISLESLPFKNLQELNDFTGLTGKDTDLYRLEISNEEDSQESALAIEKAEAIEKAAQEETGKVTEERESVDLEFLDTPEKGELIDLLRDCIAETTGVIDAGKEGNFQRFLVSHDDRINRLVGQFKVNTLKYVAAKDTDGAN